MGTVLVPFAQEFARERGYDPEYMAAQVVRRFAIIDQERYGERLDFLGWGLGVSWHGDIEYFYKVFPSGEVRAYRVDRVEDDLLDSEFPAGAIVKE